MLVATLVFIILGLASAHFFRRPIRDQRLRFRLHQAASLFLSLVHVAAAAFAPLAGDVPILLAMALLIAGVALFLWAQETVKHAPPYQAFSGVTPEQLFVAGPYQFVRHPIYLAFTAIWLAVPIATWNPWLLASAVMLTANFVAAAREEEAAFARTPYAERHRAYALRTGMFLPRARALVPRFDRPWSPVAIAAIAVAVGLSVALLWELLAP